MNPTRIKIIEANTGAELERSITAWIESANKNHERLNIICMSFTCVATEDYRIHTAYIQYS